MPFRLPEAAFLHVPQCHGVENIPCALGGKQLQILEAVEVIIHQADMSRDAVGLFIGFPGDGLSEGTIRRNDIRRLVGNGENASAPLGLERYAKRLKMRL